MGVAPGRRPQRGSSLIGPGGLLLAALLGTWLGHSAEYLRVWGSGQFPSALSRSAHGYFGPLGIILLGAGAIAVQVSLRLAERFERRLSGLHALLLGAPALGPGGDDRPRGPSGWVIRFPILVAIMWVVQLSLYVAQENLEAHAAGLPLPGLGAVSGLHAIAPVVQLIVAFAVGAVVWLARRRVTELTAEAQQAERSLLRRHRRRRALRALMSTAPTPTPSQRWGMALWARPPPLTVAGVPVDTFRAPILL